MKSVMGFAFFLLFMAGIMFATMLEKPREPAATASDTARFTGVTWHPVVVANQTLAEDSGLAVVFELDGGIHGHGGCNTFRGSIERSESDVTVGQLATTRMACPIDIMVREDTFLAAMQKVRKMAGEGDELRLLDEHGGVLVVLTAAAESEK